MASQLENIVNVYKRLAKIPSILSGKLNSRGDRITSKWSVRNFDKGKTTKYNLDNVLNDDLRVISESGFGVDCSNELLSSISPLDTYRAVIREEKDAKDAKKQYLEVWTKNNLAHCIDLTALDIHGDVYADSEFGTLDWSHDESALVYIAERKLPKCEPYIKRKNEDKAKPNGDAEPVPKKGEEYLYRQDWGEQLVGKHLSSIVVCQLQTEKCIVLEGLPDSWCPGQVRFAPDGKSVVGVAWETEPRRLGLIFCTNRPGFIFNLTLDGNLTKLSAEGLSVRSPRVSPSGHVLWLQRAVGGPHHACHALVAKNESNEVTTLIDIVETERAISNGKFHGLYCQALPSKCFAADGRLVFSTPQQNEVRSYVADIDGGRLVDISNNVRPCSTTVLDIRNDVVLAACSDLTAPGQLYVARLPAAGHETEIKWLPVSQPNEAPDGVRMGSTVEYLHLQHQDSTDKVRSFSAIYFAPNVENKKLPLIVWPHGGPHSNFVNAFSIEAALFNLLGFASIQINYRGSSGAGQASLLSLLKRVGDFDVKDCKLATDEAIKRYPIDPKRVCLTGGSHGGLLVTHLSGQYPDMYRVVVSRNPAIDIATMFNSSDIPDWCAVEAGFEFRESGPMSEEELLAMRRCSPLAHVHKVKAPTALMLGSGDKRVPHYQGLEYARRLKANGVPVRIYMYEDNHSLSSLPAEMDNLINGAHWFLMNLDS